MSRNNVLKSGWLSVDSENKMVIDAEGILAKKLGFCSYEKEGQDDALTNRLITERSAEIESEQETAPERDYVREAMEEAERIREEAFAEIEQEKSRVFEEARAQGYEEGHAQGREEGLQEFASTKQDFEEKEAQIRREYEKKVKELEPMFIDTLTEIYEHVFQVDFSDDRSVIMHLLDMAIHGIESGKDFVIRVSKEDYPYATMQRKKLSVVIPNSTIELVEDQTLAKNQCLIETGGGVFDCSVDVELYALGKKLRLLARTKS